MQPLAEEQITTDLIKILKDLTSDWDIDNFSGAITGQTKLVADLSFESIELVQLMVAIEQHFKIKNLASEKLLMRDGRYVADLSVAEISHFLASELKSR